MTNREKKVLRFVDNDSPILNDGNFTPFDDITLRSSIGSPIAASSVARPLLTRGKGYREDQDLDFSHTNLFQKPGKNLPQSKAKTQSRYEDQDNDDGIPDSARSRASFAPSEMTDTSLGILNLDDLVSGLEELDDEFMDLSQDPNSPRSGIGDGEEEMTPTQGQPFFRTQGLEQENGLEDIDRRPKPTNLDPDRGQDGRTSPNHMDLDRSLGPGQSPNHMGNTRGCGTDSNPSPFGFDQRLGQEQSPSSRDGGTSRMALSRMSAPSIRFCDSQEEDEGLPSDLSDIDGQAATPTPLGQRSRTQGTDGGGSSEIDTEDEINAVKQELALRQDYSHDPADRLGVGESRDDSTDEDVDHRQHHHHHYPRQSGNHHRSGRHSNLQQVGSHSDIHQPNGRHSSVSPRSGNYSNLQRQIGSQSSVDSDTRLESTHVPRLQLDGGNSENDDHMTASLAEPRQSAEGEVVVFDPGDGGGGGDGMSDGETTSSGPPDMPVTFGQSTLMAFQGQGLNLSSREWTLSGQQFEGEGMEKGQLPVSGHDDHGDDHDDADDEDDDENCPPHMDVFKGQSRIQPIGETDVWTQGPLNLSHKVSPAKKDAADIPQSPVRNHDTTTGAAVNPFDSFSGAGLDAREGSDMGAAFNHSFPGDGAFNPFDSGPGSGADFSAHPQTDLGLGGQEEFFGQDDAMAMIDKDQKDFEKENIFRQDEDMSHKDDNQDSWELPDGSHMTLRMSMHRSKVTSWEDEASYRNSLGTVIAMRSEALGSLFSDAEDAKPHFGDGTIISPPPHPAVALVSRSESFIQEEDEVESLYAASEREEGVGQNLSENQNQDGANSGRGQILFSGFESSKESKGTREDYNPNKNRSGVYVPPRNSSFPIKREELKNNDGGRRSVSPPSDSSEGYKTPPLNLSMITAAIAQASSTADPQQLAKMILAMSHQTKKKQDKAQKTSDDAISQNEDDTKPMSTRPKTLRNRYRSGDDKVQTEIRLDGEEVSFLSSHVLGLHDQRTDISGSSRHSSEKRTDISGSSRHSSETRTDVSGSSRRSGERLQLPNERLSIEGSGGSDQDSRSSRSSRGSSSGRPRREWRKPFEIITNKDVKAVHDPRDKVESRAIMDHQNRKEGQVSLDLDNGGETALEYQEGMVRKTSLDHQGIRDGKDSLDRQRSLEHLGDKYLNPVLRESMLGGHTQMSDTIPFQDNGDGDVDKAEHSNVTHVEHWKGFLPNVDKFSSVPSQKGFDEKSNMSQSVIPGKHSGINRRDVRHPDHDDDSEMVRRSGKYTQGHRDSSSGAASLEGPSTHTSQFAHDSKARGSSGPGKSKSDPYVSEQKVYGNGIEQSRSEHKGRMYGKSFERGIHLGIPSEYDVLDREVSGQIQGQRNAGESRSQAIPDGEPTPRDVATMQQRYPVNGADEMLMSPTHNWERTSDLLPYPHESVGRLSPRAERYAGEYPSSARDSTEGLPEHQNASRSPRQQRSSDGRSSRVESSSIVSNGEKTETSRSMPDFDFKKPAIPVASKRTKSREPKAPTLLTVDAMKRFTEQQSGLDFGDKMDASRFSIDSQADIVVGKHVIKQTPREKKSGGSIGIRRVNQAEQHHYRQGKKDDSHKDIRDRVTIDADVDSGFSSEHPQRASNAAGTCREAVTSLSENRENVQDKVEGYQLQPKDGDEEDMENDNNFSMLSKVSLSPTPPPRRSLGHSPIGPSKEARRTDESDIDRTLIADSPELASPKSNSSSRSRDRSRSDTASSSSGSMHSTPKSKKMVEGRTTDGDLDSCSSNLSNASTKLLYPQMYVQPPQVTAHSSLPSSMDPSKKPIMSSHLEPPSFLTNQALSETNFQNLYLNDRPISRLSPTSLGFHGMLPQSGHVSHLEMPVRSMPPDPSLYLAPHPGAGVGTSLYAPSTVAGVGPGLYAHSQAMTQVIPTPATLHSLPHPAVSGASHQLPHQRHFQPYGHLRSHSAEPVMNTHPSWSGYNQASIISGSHHLAGIVDSSVTPGARIPSSAVTGQQAGPQSTIVSQLVVPSEHRLKDVACIGIAVQDVIHLQNPSSRWLQCTLEVVSISVNGEELQMEKASHIFITRPRLIIGPHTSEEHKIMFAPRQPGIYEARIQVGSSPVVADSEAGLLRVTAPHMMCVRAVAELPEIEVDGAMNGKLDFGEMVFGSERSKVICLINKGLSSIPVRVFCVNNTTAMWYAASLTTEENIDHSTTNSPRRPLHITLPGRSSTTVDGKLIHQSPSMTVKLQTQPRPSNKEGASLGPLELVNVNLKIELDVPDRVVSLADLDLCAKVGVAKLHLPEALANEQTLKFSTAAGSTTSRNLLLKNAGNIKLDMRLRLPRGADCFEVVPDMLVLDQGQQRDVLVRYTPKEDLSVVDIPLFIQVQPDGPNYELALRGEIATKEERKRSKVKSPPLLCNKLYLAWGGLPLGKSLKKSAVLRNSSKELLTLKLVIHGSEDFQLQSGSGGQIKLCTTRQVVIKPQQDFTIDVIFMPSQLANSKATLNIKPTNGEGKYTIPLTGYGGVSNLVIEDVNLRGDTYVHDVGSLTPGQYTVLTIKVRNSGLRAGFVKALCFTDTRAKVRLPSSHLNIEPSEFVISPKMRKTLTLIYNPKESDFASMSDYHTKQEVAAVGLYYGDEVLRQVFRRSLRTGSADQPHLASDNPLRGVAFDVKYVGEEHVQEEFDMEPETNTGSLFYSRISRVLLSLTGRLAKTKGKEMSPPQPLRHKAPPSGTTASSSHRPSGGPSIDPPLSHHPSTTTSEMVTSSKYHSGTSADTVYSKRTSGAGVSLEQYPSGTASAVVSSSRYSPSAASARPLPLEHKAGALATRVDPLQHLTGSAPAASAAATVAHPIVAALPVVPTASRHPDTDDLPSRVDSSHGIVLVEDTLIFDDTLVGQSRTVKLKIKNTSKEDQTVTFLKPNPPFHIHHRDHTIRGKHFLRVPVTFRPQAPGKYQTFMVIQMGSDHSLVAKLTGHCI